MKKSKLIVEAGLFVAIYAAFFLVSIYIPGLFENFLSYLLPIPLAIFSFKYGVKYSLIPFVASAIVAFLINPYMAIFYVLTSNILGVVYGAMVKKDVIVSKRILVCMVIGFITSVCTMYLFAGLLEYDIKEDIMSLFAIILKIFRINFEDQTIMNNIISASIPIFLFATGAIQGYATHVFITLSFRKLKLKQLSVGNTYFMLMPKWVGIVGLISIILHIGTGYFFYVDISRPLFILSFILLDLAWIFILILAVQGYFSLLLKMAGRKYTSIILLLILVLLILVPLPILVLLSIYGIIVIFTGKDKTLLYNNKY